MTDTMTTAAAARLATDNEFKLAKADRKAWLAGWSTWQDGLGLKAKAATSYTALGAALAETPHATNSWQLADALNIAEGTLYAAITVAHRAGMITRISKGRSHFYVPTVQVEAKAPKAARKPRQAKAPKQVEAPSVEADPAADDTAAA